MVWVFKRVQRRYLFLTTWITPCRSQWSIGHCLFAMHFIITKKFSYRWQSATHLPLCANANAWLTSPYVLTYRDKFGCSLCVKWCSHKYRRTPSQLRSAGIPLSLGMGGLADPEITPLPTCVTTSNLVVLRQRGYA